MATQSLTEGQFEPSTGIRPFRLLAGAIRNGLIFALKFGESSRADGCTAEPFESPIEESFNDPEYVDFAAAETGTVAVAATLLVFGPADDVRYAIFQAEQDGSLVAAVLLLLLRLLGFLDSFHGHRTGRLPMPSLGCSDVHVRSPTRATRIMAHGRGSTGVGRVTDAVTIRCRRRRG